MACSRNIGSVAEAPAMAERKERRVAIGPPERDIAAWNTASSTMEADSQAAAIQPATGEPIAEASGRHATKRVNGDYEEAEQEALATMASA
jgi:hypothetical protein